MIPRAFAAALLDPGAPCPAGLVTWNGSDPAQRFGVYRNNVTASLIDALADTFPVVVALVGPAFFRALAGEFARRSPPTSPVLAWYGEAFADFIANFPPAAGVPYLADVARLEYARVLAFHAADAAPVPTASLADRLAEPDTLPALSLRLHPSLQVVVSPYAITSLWGAHHGHGALATIDPGRAESALVLRHGLAVEVIALASGPAAFISALRAGTCLGEALLRASEADACFDPAPILGLLIGHDAIVGLGDAPPPSGEIS